MPSFLKRPSGASSFATAACFVLGTGLLLTLASCGDSDGSAQSATTITIQPTSYVIREQVTTTSTPVQNSADAEGRSGPQAVTLFDSTGLAIQDLALCLALVEAYEAGRVKAATVRL